MKDLPDGPARNELDGVLSNAQKHVKDLEDHIKEGEKLAEDKEKNIETIDEDIDKTNPVDVA